MGQLLQFLFAASFVGFEYWTRHGIEIAEYRKLLWLIFPGLLITWMLLVGLRIRWLRHSREPVSAGSIVFSSPMFLVAFCLLGAVNVACVYPDTEVTLELLVLPAGILLSQGIAAWNERMRQRGKGNRFPLQMIANLVAVLALAGMCHPNWSDLNQLYEYRGALRWTGPVKDPNIFGLLMAVGVVLATALLPMVAGKHFPFPAASGDGVAASAAGRFEKRRFLAGLVLSLCLSVLLLAWIKSYSRGAWLSALVGWACLALSWRTLEIRRRTGVRSGADSAPERIFAAWPRFTGFMRRNRSSLALIAGSLLILGYCCLRHTEVRVIRRMFSPANTYDFSWRNRLVAGTGALQIIADNPWSGVGWKQQEIQYNEYYRPSRLTEGLAIFLNDYFTLGMVFGLPALVCFVMGIWMAFGKREPGQHADPAASGTTEGAPEIGGWTMPEEWAREACRAGSIVLLVGFWFDRGLLTVPVGLLFWVLVGLGGVNGGFVSHARPAAIRDAGRPGRFPAPGVSWILPLIGVVFIAGLLRAREQDPYRRVRFLLTGADNTTTGIAVLPKLAARYPVAIYVHGSGESLLTSGTHLRQIADQGLAAVGIEYDQGNQAAFDDQLIALCRFVQGQPWAQSNIVWIGSGLGAQRTLAFVCAHPAWQPNLFVQIEGRWTSGLDEPLQGTARGSQLSCPVLLVQSRGDSLVSTNDAYKLAGLLRAAGAPVQMCFLDDSSHSPDRDHPSVLREVAEYCAARLPPPDYAARLPKPYSSGPAALQFNRTLQQAGQNRDQLWSSIAALPQPQLGAAMTHIRETSAASFDPAAEGKSERPPARPFLVIAGLSAAGLFLLWKCVGRVARPPAILFPSHASSIRPEAYLRWTALGLALAAAALVSVDLVFPRLQVNPSRLAAERRLFDSFDADDSRYLIPAAPGVSVGRLLENIQLAELQREQFYAGLERGTFQPYVLSPAIDSQPAEWGWRRIFWENFQPRVRKEHDPVAGAGIVVEYLRERVGIDPSLPPGVGIETIWNQQRTEGEGFQRIYVAVLRSIGIAARFNDLRKAELWTGKEWRAAPPPLLDWIPVPEGNSAGSAGGWSYALEKPGL